MEIINKNIVKKFGLKSLIMLFWALVFLMSSYSEARKITDPLDPIHWLNYAVSISWAYMDQYFSMVHFNVKGNDFGWGILWLPVEQITWDAVEIRIPTAGWTDSVFCTSKIRGFYRNSQRWDNRLRPLDDKTHEWLYQNATHSKNPELYTGLVFSWWWYTTCSEDKPTAELNQYLNEKWVWLSEKQLSEILDTLEKNSPTVSRDDWTSEFITWILFTEFEITDTEVMNKIAAAIRDKASFKIDPYWIYWNITHKFGWETINLVAWAHYDINKNRISEWNLTCSLQRLGNNYPFWYLYDDYGHIWTVWARITYNYLHWSNEDIEIGDAFHSWLNNALNSGYCVNQIFWYDWENIKLIIKDEDADQQWVGIPWWCETKNNCDKLPSGWIKVFLNAWNGTARTTIFSLWIKGIIGLTDEVRESQKEYYENNQLQSTLMLRTETSISNIINKVNKNAEALCRGKWIDKPNGADTEFQKSNTKLVCYQWKWVNDVISTTPKWLKWKSVVIRNASLEINLGEVGNYQDGSEAINLFINKWNLYLNSSGIDLNPQTAKTLPCFDDYGYLLKQDECIGDVDAIRAMYLKGNFIVDGLILWGKDEAWEIWKAKINSRLYVHGKIVSYNTLTTPTATRKKTIDNLLGWEYSKYDWVSFMKLFGWSCDPIKGEGTDWTSCKWKSAVGKESQLVDKAFWLIDMDIPWELVNY